MEKKPLTPKKLQQKVSQLILLGFGVPFNILKVEESLTPGNVFFLRWRPKWPPKPLCAYNSVTISSNVFGVKEHIKIIKNDGGLLCNIEIQYCTKNLLKC